jgi:hypothetical protein
MAHFRVNRCHTSYKQDAKLEAPGWMQVKITVMQE